MVVVSALGKWKWWRSAFNFGRICAKLYQTAGKRATLSTAAADDRGRDWVRPEAQGHCDRDTLNSGIYDDSTLPFNWIAKSFSFSLLLSPVARKTRLRKRWGLSPLGHRICIRGWCLLGHKHQCNIIYSRISTTKRGALKRELAPLWKEHLLGCGGHYKHMQPWTSVCLSSTSTLASVGSKIINRKSNRGSLQFVDINQMLIFVSGERPVNYSSVDSWAGIPTPH